MSGLSGWARIVTVATIIAFFVVAFLGLVLSRAVSTNPGPQRSDQCELLATVAALCLAAGALRAQGMDWVKATDSAAWPGREEFASVSFNNEIWILGGTTSGHNRNEPGGHALKGQGHVGQQD